MPTTTIPFRGSGGIKANIVIEENVTPVFLVAEKYLPIAMREAMLEYGNTIVESVKNEYEERRGTYKNTLNTFEQKGRKKPLENSGRLKDSIEKGKSSIIEDGRGSCTLVVEWKLPTSGGTGIAPSFRKNNAMVYLWSHEFGTNETIPQIMARSSTGGFRLIKSEKWGLPTRDFFIDGIQKGIDKGSIQAGGRISAAADLEKMSLNLGGKPFKFAGDVYMQSIFPSLISTSLTGLIWYLVPPSKYYAAIGMASDMMGFLRGSFFSWGIAGNYAKAMAWGRTGMSKKVIRRRFRGGLWGRD